MWVDITTITNNQPFMKVRWKEYFSNPGIDTWFAESPNIVSDNMSWFGGTKEYGWFSAHRMNGGSYGPVYCCSFNYDHTATGFWDVEGQNYQVSLKNGNRSQYYDTTVTISGDTYYEVDFSLWSGASGYNLYAPYSTMPWDPGDIFVYIDSAISIDKDSMTFESTGGTDTVVIDAEDSWTAVVSDNWITASTLSGASGQTTVTISTPDYQDTTSARTGTVVFTCSGETVTLTVKQKKVDIPVYSDYNVFLGADGIQGLFLGSDVVEGIYLGADPIYVPSTGLRISPEYNVVNQNSGSTTTVTIASDDDWNISIDPNINWLSLSSSSGSSGTSQVTMTCGAFYGVTSRFAFLTASTVNTNEEKIIVVRQQYQGTGTTANNMLYHASAQVAKNTTQGNFSPAETSHTFDSNTYIGEYCFSSTYSGVNGTFRAKFVSSGSDVKLVGCTDITRAAGKNGMFNTCTGLRCIEFGEGIVNIGSATMPSSTTLHEIIIGSTIQTIAENQTVGDASVNTIMILATTPPQINGNPFNGSASTGYLLVPKNSVSAYTTWASSMTNIANWTIIGI